MVGSQQFQHMSTMEKSGNGSEICGAEIWTEMPEETQNVNKPAFLEWDL